MKSVYDDMIGLKLATHQGELIMKTITEQEFEEKAKLLKKTDKKADTLESKNLSDEELDNVEGGSRRKKGYAQGWWIECPDCGCNVHEGIDAKKDKKSTLICSSVKCAA